MEAFYKSRFGCLWCSSADKRRFAEQRWLEERRRFVLAVERGTASDSIQPCAEIARRSLPSAVRVSSRLSSERLPIAGKSPATPLLSCLACAARPSRLCVCSRALHSSKACRSQIMSGIKVTGTRTPATFTSSGGYCSSSCDSTNQFGCESRSAARVDRG